MKHLLLLLLLMVSVTGCQRQVRMILVYEVDRESTPDEETVGLERVARAVNHRVNPGSRRGRVRVLDDGRIEVGLFDDDPVEVERMDRVIQAVGTLEFRILANNRDHASLIERAKKTDASKIYHDERRLLAWWLPLVTGEEWTLDADSEIVFRETGPEDQKTTEVLVVNDPFCVNDSYLVRATTGSDQRNRPSLSISFNSRGGALMRGLTGDALPDEISGYSRRLGIILNGSLYAVPAIQAVIGEGAEITGDFTQAEVEDLALVLSAGTLPAKIKKVNQRKVNGED